MDEKEKLLKIYFSLQELVHTRELGVSRYQADEFYCSRTLAEMMVEASCLRGVLNHLADYLTGEGILPNLDEGNEP